MSLQDYRIQDPVLTALAQGYHNTELVGDALFPVVEIPKEAGRIPQFGRLAFLSQSTIRELHGDSNRLAPEYALNIAVNLEEHDIEYPIDYREEHDASYELKQYALSVVQGIIALGREVEIAKLVQNSASYLDGHVKSLTTDEKFSNTKSKPLKIFDEAISFVHSTIGRKPNVCVISEDVWRALKENETLLECIKYTRTGILTPQVFSELIDVPIVKIGSAAKGVFKPLKVSNPKYHPREIQSLEKIWVNSVILAYAPEHSVRKTVYEPSFGYTVRRKEGLFVDTYREKGGKVEVIRCTDIHKPYLVGVSAGYLIKDCI